MANETGLNTTLREVIGESVNNQTGKKSDDTDSRSGGSQQTQSGEKREFVAGLDVSDIPDNMTKTEFKEFLAKKGKLLEDGYQGKFKEVSEYKKERDALLAQGVSIKDASRMIQEAIKNNDTKAEVKKDIKREIDNLMDEAPDLETKKGVERLERVIKELAPDSPAFKELKKELDEVKKALGYFQAKNTQTRVESLNESLDKLSGNKFDKDFIDKYREKFVAEGKKWPEASISKIIQVISDPEDYEEAILRTKVKETTKENRLKEKINANDSSSSGVTGQEKQIDVKKIGFKGLIAQVMSKKR